MTTPTESGQKCLVVGGRMAYNDEGKGPNQGKTVTTVFLHAEKAGIEQEDVWHCRAEEGDSLQTYFGHGPEADFLACWLEVIETKPREQERIEALEQPA